VLIHPLGAPGLAIATAIGLWINLGALLGIAMSRQILRFDALFGKCLLSTFVASAALTLVAQLCRGPALALGEHFGSLAHLVALLTLSILGGVAYFGALIGVLRLLGLRPSALRGMGRRAPSRL
jgi:putative peptidoglycan lipid II flippase